MKNIFTAFTAILIYGGVCLLCGCAAHTGIRSGQVLNAINSEPIQGAVVRFNWIFGGVFGLGPLGGTYYETSTDKDGKYYAPSQTIDTPNIFYGNLNEKVLIYKDGYDVCFIDLSRIDSPGAKLSDNNRTYSKKNNIVKLYPWKEGESHYDHINFIDDIIRFSGKGELLKKELEPERKRAREERLTERAEKERAKKQTQK